MATRADVRRIALALPGAIEGKDRFAFAVPGKGGKEKGFAWSWMERVEPKQPRVENPRVIAVRVAGDAEKQLLLASGDDAIFTEPHYNGFPAVLVRLPAITVPVLRALLVAAWRCQAPVAVVADYDAPPIRASSGTRAKPRARRR